jgi:hypothetical protein
MRTSYGAAGHIEVITLTSMTSGGVAERMEGTNLVVRSKSTSRKKMKMTKH